MTTDTEKRLAEIRERSAELNGMYRSQADSNVDFLLAEIERLAASAAQTKLALEMMSEDFNDAAAAVDRLTAERDAAWEPIETAPKDPDLFILVYDTTLTEPTIAMASYQSGGWFGVDQTGLRYDSTGYRLQPTKWQPLPTPPAAIRALSPSTLNKPE